MVNDQNRVPGRSIDKHPLADQKGGVGVFTDSTTVLAVQAMVGGVCETVKGDVRFQAGDWIVTDNPPTRAWPVNDQLFRHTYHLIGEPPTGALPAAVSSIEKKVATSTSKGRRQSAESKRRAATPKKRAGTRMATPRTKTPPGVPGVELQPGPGQTTANSTSLGALTGATTPDGSPLEAQGAGVDPETPPA